MAVDASDYESLAIAQHVHVPQSGDRTAFVVRSPDGPRSYAADIHVSIEGESPWPFTTAAAADSEPRWSPDGELLAFVRTDGEGDDQLHIMGAHGGEPQPVTSVPGSIDTPRWSPDGTRIAFLQETTADERSTGTDVYGEVDRPDHDPRVIDRVVYRRETEYLDDRRSHLYVVDVEEALTDVNGATRRITDGDRDVHAPAWRSEAELYSAATAGEDPDVSLEYVITAYDLERDEQREVTRTAGWLPSFDVAADGRVAYRFSSLDQPGPSMNTTELRIVGADGESHTTITGNPDRRVYRTSQPQWGPDDRHVYFLSPDRGAVELRRGDPADGSAETVYRHEGSELTELSIGGSTIGAIRADWDNRSDVFYLDPSAGSATRLTDLNRSFRDRIAAEPQEVWYESSDGTEVHGWFLEPYDTSEDREYPLVVQVHGGPPIMWSAGGQMAHEFHTFAANGYAVFWCNPRGSTGYGPDHTTDLWYDWGDEAVADILAGVDTVAERGSIDEDNLFITGGSFGGYLTAWTVARSNRFAAAVAQRGVYDQIGQYGTKDAFQAMENQLGFPWNNFDEYWDLSPIAHVEAIDTPTLLLHAELDFRVPVTNAEVFFRFLKRAGVETRLVRYPREGHGLSRGGEPAHVIDRLERIRRWFDGYSDHHDAPPALERGADGIDSGPW